MDQWQNSGVMWFAGYGFAVDLLRAVGPQPGRDSSRTEPHAATDPQVRNSSRLCHFVYQGRRYGEEFGQFFPGQGTLMIGYLVSQRLRFGQDELQE